MVTYDIFYFFLVVSWLCVNYSGSLLVPDDLRELVPVVLRGRRDSSGLAHLQSGVLPLELRDLLLHFDRQPLARLEEGDSLLTGIPANLGVDHLQATCI